MTHIIDGRVVTDEDWFRVLGRIAQEQAIEDAANPPLVPRTVSRDWASGSAEMAIKEPDGAL